MELHFRTLTPLHVGDGTQLHSFDYVVHGGRYYRISQQQFERFLKAVDAEDPERRHALAFVDWADEMATKIETVDTNRQNAGRQGARDYNQELSRLRGEYNLLSFARRVGKDRHFIEFLTREVRGLPIFTEAGTPKQEIRGFIRGADGRAYLPGSTIKGSLRTALLYHYLTQHADYESIHERLTRAVAKLLEEKAEAERRRGRFSAEKSRKSFAEFIEHDAFFAGMITERGQARPAEAQNDLLRCLLVGDVTLPEDSLGVENIDLYLVKKLPKGQGTQAQRQPQSPAVEAVQPGQVFSVKLGFNLDLLLKLHRANPGDDGVLVGRERHFIGWRKKARWLFNLEAADFDSVPPGTRPNDARWQNLHDKAINHVLQCVRTFVDAQAEAYVRWQENYVKPDHRGGDNASKVGAGGKSIRAADLRLHLGFATGFEGMTEVLYLLARHKRLFADIMELFGIGDSPSAWRNRKPGETYRANPDQFPKSRRLVSRAAAALPLGWLVQVEAGTPSGIAFEERAEAVAPVPPPLPATPSYLRGSVKIGAEVNAELTSSGSPGRFKLFIRTDYTPVIEVKYAAGFKESDLGRVAILRIKNVKGKEEVLAVEFLRFK